MPDPASPTPPRLSTLSGPESTPKRCRRSERGSLSEQRIGGEELRLSLDLLDGTEEALIRSDRTRSLACVPSGDVNGLKLVDDRKRARR